MSGLYLRPTVQQAISQRENPQPNTAYRWGLNPQVGETTRTGAAKNCRSGAKVSL